MTTDLLARFDALLGDSEDFNWTDYSAYEVNMLVMLDFAEPDWKALQKLVLQKPEYWQQRCVVSLGENRSLHAIEICKFLLENSPWLDVKIMAIYELDWSEIPIESRYAGVIKGVIDSLPAEEVESELTSLLEKAQSQVEKEHA